MTTARELLASKPFGGVITVDPGATVRDACRLFRDRNIGSLVVFDGMTFSGIFTERDVVKRVVAEGLSVRAVEEIVAVGERSTTPRRSLSSRSSATN